MELLPEGISCIPWTLEVSQLPTVKWMQMGNSCPCQASFDEQHLQAAEKWISRGQVKLYNKQSLHKLLLVEDLEKIAFGLWGCVQSAAWTPPAGQVRLFPEITPCWLKYLCSLLNVTLPESELHLSWEVFLSSALRGFSPDVFWAWNNFVLEEQEISMNVLAEMKNLGGRSHSVRRKICPKCKLLMQVLLRCAPGMQTLSTSGSVANSQHSSLVIYTARVKAPAADCTRWHCEESTEAFCKQGFKWEGLLW